MNPKNPVNTPALHCRYIPSLELISAADSAGPRKPQRSRASLEGGENRERQKMIQKESPFRRADLDLLFAPVSTALFLFHTVFERGLEEPEDLIAHLKELSVKDLLSEFKSLLRVPGEEQSWINAETIEKALIKDRARESVPLDEEARQIYHLLLDPFLLKTKLAEVLEWFYHQYLVQELDERSRQAESWIQDHQEMIEKDPWKLLSQLTDDCCGSLLQGYSEVNLYPVSHNSASEIWVMLPDTAHIVSTQDYLREKISNAPEDQLREDNTDALMETLSDAKRFAILRLLRGKPRYGREIAEEMGISPSTASYHIEKLMAAHLVRIEISRGRRFYYTLNKEGFADFLTCLRHEFID